MGPKPDHRRARAVDQLPCHVFVGLMMGHLHQRIIEDVPVMHRQYDAFAFGVRQIGQHIPCSIVDAGMAKAKTPGGKI